MQASEKSGLEKTKDEDGSGLSIEPETEQQEMG
jgi:hypothetical protein